MLSELHLRDVGPAPALDVEFAERLNIFTGDNGLGKTFLLDCVWWALTGTCRELPLPRRGEGTQPRVRAVFDPTTWTTDTPIFDAQFAAEAQFWMWSQRGQLTRSLVIHAGADGRYSVYDPARNHKSKTIATTLKVEAGVPVAFSDRVFAPAYYFSQSTLMNGPKDSETIFCNGLIHDWVHWQLRDRISDLTSPFAILRRVLDVLSHPDEVLTPGSPTRTSMDDARDIPTIRLPYGEVPITQASAGMKRIVSLAYLLVWAWVEHLIATELFGQPRVDRLVLLVDEAELHLHPKWQRSIVPALLEVARGLNEQIETQLIVTTHSPLVLASIEPEFDKERDRLFLFDVEEGQVDLKELPWAKHGDATNWLTSPIFGLAQARSRESESAIEAAEAFMRGDFDALPDGLKTKEEIHAELRRVVAGHDEFWPRWIIQECEVAR